MKNTLQNKTQKDAQSLQKGSEILQQAIKLSWAELLNMQKEKKADYFRLGAQTPLTFKSVFNDNQGEMPECLSKS